jgi:predicted DNA-binding transcriptional regulator AlpA
MKSDPQPSRPRRLLRLPQVLERINVGKSTFLKKVQDGKVQPGHKWGHIRFWDEDYIDELVEEIRRGEAQP